jgi:hypothetical protein
MDEEKTSLKITGREFDIHVLTELVSRDYQIVFASELKPNDRDNGYHRYIEIKRKWRYDEP